MTRGAARPEAKRSTAKPGGAWGTTAGVLGALLGKLAAERVAKGGGMSAGVISRRTPGASVIQSPKAADPVSTRPSAASAVAAASEPARRSKPVRIVSLPGEDLSTGAEEPRFLLSATPGVRASQVVTAHPFRQLAVSLLGRRRTRPIGRCLQLRRKSHCATIVASPWPQRLEKAKSALPADETVERAAERLGYFAARSFRCLPT